MFKIGEFSKLSNTTVRTLDHYAALGLLEPETIDSQTNYRYYSASQLSRLNQIKLLQQTINTLLLIFHPIKHRLLRRLLLQSTKLVKRC